MLHIKVDFGEEKNKQLKKLIEDKIIPLIRDEGYGQIDIGIKKGKIVNCGVRETDNEW